MTLVIIDVSDVASGTHPDDKVVFWAPQHRPGTTTAKHQVSLVNGVGEEEMKPGPTMVQFQCRGIADTAPKMGTVAESGTVTLDDVLAGSFTYTPAVVNSALERITTARDAALGDVDGAVADALAPASVYTGTGSPEGQVAASVGAVYTDTAATAGAIRWIKTRGTGTTGWRVQFGDTGSRDVSAFLLGDVEGNVYIRRTESGVSITGTSVRPRATGNVPLLHLPEGFRSMRTTVGAAVEGLDFRPIYALRFSPYLLEFRGITSPDSWVNFDITIAPAGLWPTLLPGTPS